MNLVGYRYHRGVCGALITQLIYVHHESQQAYTKINCIAAAYFSFPVRVGYSLDYDVHVSAKRNVAVRLEA